MEISEVMKDAERRLYDDPFKTKLKVRNDPLFPRKDVLYFTAKEITTIQDNVIRRGTKTVTNTFEEATEVLKKSEALFGEHLTAFNDTAAKLSTAVKKTSGDVRKSAHEVGDGVQKVMKNINLDQLERSVVLLERAAGAMYALAELQKDGRLDKILDAMKK